MLAANSVQVKTQDLAGTWLWDLEKGAFRGNGLVAELFDVGESDLIPKNKILCFRQRIHESDRERVLRSFDAVERSGLQYIETYRVYDVFRRERRVFSHATAIRNKLGVPVEMYGVMQDVTGCGQPGMEAPSPLDLTADALLSARAQSIRADDKFLTYLIEVCLQHLASPKTAAGGSLTPCCKT